MGADLFESYVDSIIATMALGAIAVFSTQLAPSLTTAWFLPMLVAGGGIIASIIGIFAVRVGKVKAKMGALLNALRRGTVIASILTGVFAFLAVHFLAPSERAPTTSPPIPTNRHWASRNPPRPERGHC
jgi:K(+)-stimulated pyrophosphate-energized sodium pump